MTKLAMAAHLHKLVAAMKAGGWKEVVGQLPEAPQFILGIKGVYRGEERELSLVVDDGMPGSMLETFFRAAWRSFIDLRDNARNN